MPGRLLPLIGRLWRRGARTRAARYARVAAAFVLTLAFFTALTTVFLAAQARVALPAPQSALEEEPGRSAALQAVERVFLLSADDRIVDADAGLLVSRDAHARREAALQGAAEDAAIAFLGAVEVARGAEVPALIALREALEAEPRQRGRAREALSALAAAVARGEVRLRATPEELTALAGARLRSRRDALLAEARRGRAGPIGRRTEARFYEARGEAYAWALLLRGAGRDLGAAVAEAGSLAALDRAALYQPLFIFNAGRGNLFAASHLAHLALDLTSAADGLAPGG